MTVSIFQLAAGLGLLTGGAELLVRGGASLARRLGLTPLIIGLTVVAFGTSAPELVVSIGGVLQGHGDLAVGNVVGSNIFNIGVILGLAALITPMRINLSIIRMDAPILIAISLLCTWLMLGGHLTRPVGTVLILLLIAYTAIGIRLSKRAIGEETEQEFAEGIPASTRSLGHDLLFICSGLGLLTFGSQLFVQSSAAIARALGVGEAVIGLTIVAVGTSMPELATSVVAALRKQPDISVGNIIGSNIFNLLGVLGVSSAIGPLNAPGIGRLDLWTMTAYSVALLPLLWTGHTLKRGEGALLLAGYLVYLWFLWPAT